MTHRHDRCQINIERDHNCFGCGRLNEYGLQLAFFPDARDGVRTHFVPESRFEGYAGMVHGGVISTVLDEVMAWSLYRNQVFAVTAELSVRYRAPLKVGESTQAIGWEVSRRGRRINMAAEIVRDAGGTVISRAKAVFMQVSEAQADEWQSRYLGTGAHLIDED